MQDLLKVQDLEISIFTKSGPVRAVDGISYSIKKGETLGIVGESGCGKSLTSFAVMRLLTSPCHVTKGRVEFSGESLLNLSEERMRQYRGHRVAMIFQEPMTALNPVLTIGMQIVEQIQAHKKVSTKEASERAIELLKLVGIPSPEKRVENYPHQMSGGMRQRAMIAMALSCDPELLIADEPTTALDVTIQAQILELLMELKEKNGMAIQFITHDLGVISEVADRVIVMYAGKIVEEAPVDEIFNNPKHPYTKGLIASVPTLEGKVDRLRTIEGTVPSLTEMPKGCRFQNRCPNAEADCMNQAPDLISIDSGHDLACYHP